MKSNLGGSAGRVAVVTGANKGIGFCIALQLGLSGLFEHVFLACRDIQRGQVAVKHLRAQLTASSPEASMAGGVQVSCAPLTLGDEASHSALAKHLTDTFGRVDVLVNNAAMAYKNADPTPFQEQCKPTLDVNYRGTLDLTQKLLPLLKKGRDPRIVNVASMSGRLGQLSPALQQQFASPDLTLDQLDNLVNDYETSVMSGTHNEKGWGRSNYGLSKLSVIAATKVLARDNPDIKINACCPGYCKTDMTSQQGLRDPMEGAKNAVLPATMENCPTGEFFSNYEVAQW